MAGEPSVVALSGARNAERQIAFRLAAFEQVPEGSCAGALGASYPGMVACG
jgi:hypothetical protein